MGSDPAEWGESRAAFAISFRENALQTAPSAQVFL